MDYQYSATLSLTTADIEVGFIDRKTSKKFAARYVLIINDSDSSNSAFANFVGSDATQGDWEIIPGAHTSVGDRWNVFEPGRKSVGLVSDGTASVRILALG